MLTTSLSRTQHSTLLQEPRPKDITGHGTTHVSTKLSGYVWIGSKTKLVHIPEDQADDVINTMDDVAEDEIDRRADALPKKKVPQEPMEGVGSQEREETQEEPGDSDQTERAEFPPGNSPQERYGNFIMSQFSVQEFLQLRQWVFNLTSGLSEEERREQRLPLTPDDVSTTGNINVHGSACFGDTSRFYVSLSTIHKN